MVRALQPDSARSRPIPPDSARSRPIPPDSSPHPLERCRTGVLTNEGCSPIPPDSSPHPPEQCLDRGARKRGLQPDPARSCPIPPDPARFRHNKNGHAHPRNKKYLPAAPLLAIFFQKWSRAPPKQKKICQQHPCWQIFFVRWYPLRFWEFCCLEVAWLELKYATNFLTLTITRWESALSNSTFIPAWWAATTAFKAFGLPSLCCSTAE